MIQNCSLRNAFFTAALVLGTLHSGSAQELQLSKDPVRLEITANRHKSTKIEGGDWDDKTERISLDIGIRYPVFNKPALADYQLKSWVFTQSIKNPRNYKLIITDSTTFSVAAGGPEFEHATEEVSVMWDNTNAIFGEKYEGWVVAVLNPAGEVVAIKSSKPMWEKKVALLGGLKKNSYYTMNLEPVDKGDLK